MNTKIKYLHEERYGGGDGRAINRHCTRIYCDENGIQYHLDQNLSLMPPCYEALGPIPPGFKGLLPTIKIDENRYFGDGLPWSKATEKFLEAVTQLQNHR